MRGTFQIIFGKVHSITHACGKCAHFPGACKFLRCRNLETGTAAPSPLLSRDVWLVRNGIRKALATLLISERRSPHGSLCIYCARPSARLHGCKAHFPLSRNSSVTGLWGSQVTDTGYPASGAGWNGSVRENRENIKLEQLSFWRHRKGQSDCCG